MVRKFTTGAALAGLALALGFLPVQAQTGSADPHYVLRSAANSLSTSHPIVFIPNRQFASAGSRSGDSARVVSYTEVGLAERS